MNNQYTKLSSPATIGWHWWKASEITPATDILVTKIDLEKGKFKNWGGEWEHFPTYDEVAEYRASYYDLYQRAKVNEKRNYDLETALIRSVEFMNYVSETLFTPKKKIKGFLSMLQPPKE